MWKANPGAEAPFEYFSRINNMFVSQKKMFFFLYK